uniref:Ig-like domain-containing protein n=1 Tax=Seriola lalandi dorsalis TaxID=1841481 RepID=A0A3B4XU97_SERLL
MMNFTLTLSVLLLCSLSRFSLSVSEFYTVEVQPGEEVTLLCTNYTTSPTQMIWFRVVKRLKPHCVVSIFKPSESASYCGGFQNDRFDVTSNISTVFLKIKQVDLSDSGLYFCGYSINKNPVIVGATYLEVQVFDGIAKTTSVIMGALTIFLAMVIIGLVVKIIQNLQKGIFRAFPTIRNRRPASETEVETHVIHSGTDALSC